MIYDRIITITFGENRKSVNWRPQLFKLSEFYDRLRLPVRSTESMVEYLQLTKGQQDDLKDVGGFVAGVLSGPRRKANAVTGRDLLTLDLDNIPNGGTDDVVRRIAGLNCGYCIYSTRKHTPSAPRLRVLFPLDRTATADEYEPCARYMAQRIGMDLADPTTFEASRMMYLPSVCKDGQYVYYTADKPMLSVDGILATYDNWRDYTSWPAVPGAVSPARLAAKQGDPTDKSGVVGAFCRAYDVPTAMDRFLPGVYAPVDNAENRYTFCEGSTTGGAVLYDGGKFLYSHHATDPCSGKLVNSFDLVRLHCFGDLDDDSAPGTPTIKLPSYKAMCEKAAACPEVRALRAKEKQEEIRAAFQVIPDEDVEENWMQLLQVNATSGEPKATIDNIRIILEHDPQLRDKFALNKFSGRGEVLGPLPWDKSGVRRPWEDNDNAGLYWYMEKLYGITSNGKVDGALSLHSNAHAFNEVTDYLDGLHWDGTERLDRLFVTYLGAEDTRITRAMTRKAFAAAVGRAMQPGIKFDYMIILGGRQGLGKSTLLDKMSRGWYNDSIRTFEGKEASELIQGVWIVEIAELGAFQKSDVARIKQFVSFRADRFRAAYGRHVKEMPRRCVFFGTTNEEEYLVDRTGNRRYWPIKCGVQEREKSVFTDLDSEVDQLWAEAKAVWESGEPLFLPDDLESEAQRVQEEHREVSVREGVIRDFVEKEVPDDWNTWDIQKRKIFWSGGDKGSHNMVSRDRVCALEVWVEALNGDIKNMKYADAKEINIVIDAMPGWRRTSNSIRFGTSYGKQRGFVKR